MKSKIVHIIFLCLIVYPVLFFMSCSHHDDAGDELFVPDEVELTEHAELVLRVGAIGQSRAGGTLESQEMMHSLRIVIVDGAGKVEHNYYQRFDTGTEEYTCVFHVTPDKKKIYLLANEERVTALGTEPAAGAIGSSLSTFLNGVATGAEGFDEQIESIYFTPDYTKEIPMSSVYTVDVKATDRRLEQTFYLVRVATKFSFSFENERIGEDVTIKALTISKVADKNFLIPHIDDENDPVFKGKTWIDWLKEVSDLSNVDPYNPSASESGWLTGYGLPEAAKTDIAYSLQGSLLVKMPDENNNYQAGTASIKGIYIPESKNLMESPTLAGEQEYILGLVLETRQGDRQAEIKLPNLKALFRNTHVMVHVRFGVEPLEKCIYARIVDWGYLGPFDGFMQEE